MKNLFLLLVVILTLGGFNTNAQSKKKHKIVFQLATQDEKEQGSLPRQINNLLEYWPKAEIVVVVHSAALEFMMKDKSIAKDEIEKLMTQGVKFEVCRNTMKRKNVSEDQIISGGEFVPVGIAEIVERQENGYRYIKAGY